MVYVLLSNMRVAIHQEKGTETNLQISQEEPCAEDITAVSVLLSRTFSLNTAMLMGGNEATRRFMLYLWWSER